MSQFPHGGRALPQLRTYPGGVYVTGHAAFDDDDRPEDCGCRRCRRVAAQLERVGLAHLRGEPARLMGEPPESR